MATELPLPLELLIDIIRLLPLPDQRSLSLTSQLTRKLALRFIFGHLRYTENVATKICNIHLAGKDVKAAISKLELVSRYTNPNLTDDERNTLFQFLESLPNLRSFIFIQAYFLVLPTDIPKLIASLRHAPLLEFFLDSGLAVNVEGRPTIGLSGLEKLSIIWNMYDHDDHPGSTYDHLYELVRPSLSTLVDLEIDHRPSELGLNFDLQLLKPAGNTLRSFKYSVVSDDQSIFDRIPVLFPHLIKLDIRWNNTRHSLWKDEQINTLARNKNLMDLTLSSDFELESNDILKSDENFAWFVRSYKRRLKATQNVLSACENLKRCCWVQINVLPRRADLEHIFIVVERVLDGKMTKVVRGLEQEWMGRDYDCLETGGIVKCKLEDLPGDIIGENDPLGSDDEL